MEKKGEFERHIHSPSFFNDWAVLSHQTTILSHEYETKTGSEIDRADIMMM